MTQESTITDTHLAAKIAQTTAILQQAAALDSASGKVVLASSMSAEDVVLIDLIARNRLPIGIFAIDTWMLHKETTDQIARVRDHYGVEIAVFEPQQQAVDDYISANGKHAFYESLELRKSCCHIRKVEPLGRALEGASAWVTGQRREQAQSRGNLPEVETDGARNISKFNPLAAWTWQDVLDYVAAYDVPISPLYGRGYVTIGCDACTRAVRPGEDVRAARWWWEDASNKECGLHVSPVSA